MGKQLACSGSGLLVAVASDCTYCRPCLLSMFSFEHLFSFCLFFHREIWARFLAFESNIGDLASILKVEKRRFTAFKEEYEGKETALLVDRYKFMDLYPCSASELKALGYKVWR